jgi:redox-sensitive bicupin YhaK (pirin superfamily)
LPEGHSAFGYVFEGEAVRIGEDTLGARELGVLSPGDRVELSVPDDAPAARVLLVAGRPLNEQVARYGPFVMNTPEQIVQAMQDFQAGKF